jgi:hypothetical protein
MYSSSFGVTLLALTMITSVLILAVTSNVVLSLGMVGALSIVRFRAAIKEPLLAKSLTTKPKLTVKKVYEYDLQTVAGGEYHVWQKGTASEINTPLKPQESHETHKSYDLGGRQLSHPRKGVNIIDGKKIINTK